MSIATRHALSVNALSKVYGEGAAAVTAIERLDFDVDPGELLCVVGPSGAGKTTLLKCLAGLLPPTRGFVSVEGSRLERPGPDVALVFQDYTHSLLPWMSVTENVELVLGAVAPRDRRTLAGEALEDVGLAGFGDRYPWELSGGMQQRVAIARALAYRPRVLLMDEPFAAVDAQTRGELQDLTLRLRRERDITILFVTHDVDEAVYLADRILVLSAAPTRIIEVVDVGLGATRDAVATKESPSFSALRTRVLRLIRGAVRDVTIDERGARNPNAQRPTGD